MSLRKPVVVFVTKQQCELCDDSLAALRAVAQYVRTAVDVVDIASDVALAEEFGTRVPVLLGPDRSVLVEGPMTKVDVGAALVRIRLGR